MHQYDGLVYIDMGSLLAKAIEQSIHKKQLPLLAGDIVDGIIKNHVTHNTETGDYVALSNIGILFEPALQLNLHAKFSQWSREYTLIINSEGVVKDNRFYLSTPSDFSYSIDLSDIPHKIFIDEI